VLNLAVLVQKEVARPIHDFKQNQHVEDLTSKFNTLEENRGMKREFVELKDELSSYKTREEELIKREKEREVAEEARARREQIRENSEQVRINNESERGVKVPDKDWAGGEEWVQVEESWMSISSN